MTPHAAADPAARSEVIDAEKALYRAMIGRDFPALEAMLRPDLIYIHSTAVAESREAYLAGVAQGLYEYGSIASRDVRIRIDGDTAVMDGVVDMSVAAAGAPKEMTHLLFALVWVREGGKWRLYFRQATRIHG